MFLRIISPLSWIYQFYDDLSLFCVIPLAAFGWWKHLLGGERLTLSAINQSASRVIERPLGRVAALQRIYS